MDSIISQFTTLQKTGKYKEAHTLLCDAIQNKGIEDAELQWRLALICRDLALSEGKKDRAVYKKYVNEGLKAAEHGLKLDPDHPKCHSWYAIFLNYVSQLEGVNKRIENSFKMKEHWMKAITADPDDAVTLHALGRWCYEVADLPWIKRKFAEAFFSSPPTSSYEEALKYLLDSETKSPKLIAENSLYLARTYHRLKRKDEAKKYCQRVLEFTADDLETEEAKKEVTALLKNL